MPFTKEQIVIAAAVALVATFGLRGVLRGIAGIGGLVAFFVLVLVGLVFLAKFLFHSAF